MCQYIDLVVNYKLFLFCIWLFYKYVWIIVINLLRDLIFFHICILILFIFHNIFILIVMLDGEHLFYLLFYLSIYYILFTLFMLSRVLYPLGKCTKMHTIIFHNLPIILIFLNLQYLFIKSRNLSHIIPVDNLPLKQLFG